MTVVLVDGIWGRGRIFKPLCVRLEAHGHRCFVPTLLPGNAVHGIADLATKLKDFIDDRVGPDKPFALVGFSLGCIVSRYYLQQLGGHLRVPCFFAICGPHRGTWIAYCYYGHGARDVRPGSLLLQLLDSTRERLSSVALHAYWTPFDLSILPATSARWKEAAIVKLWIPFHPFAPLSSRLQTDILWHLESNGSVERAEPDLGPKRA